MLIGEMLGFQGYSFSNMYFNIIVTITITYASNYSVIVLNIVTLVNGYQFLKVFSLVQ